MPDPVITVENLGKRYVLGQAARPQTLRDSIGGLAGSLRRLARGGPPRAGAEEFWALRDVGFEVQRGDVVGVIGRNGAGKSTLLKILSRIAEPTTGRIRLRGRIASLLEVGTGFHPELSGRENIFLNGAILGMKRREIVGKFDEIVQFAEVSQFLDTPVKHYSSGMYVRLAFAVAAHLEPDILVVDEVLAVGDAQFQKKCLGKMQQVTREAGRTVLFVSHNGAALQSICRTGIWLDHGRVAATGPLRECLAAYLASGVQDARFDGRTDAPHITSVRIDHAALARGKLQIDVGFESPFKLSPPVLGVILSNKFGQPLAGSNGRMAGDSWNPPAASSGVISAEIDDVRLLSDTYRISVFLGDAGMDYDRKLDVLEFDYTSQRFYPRSPPIDVTGPLDLAWKWSLRTE